MRTNNINHNLSMHALAKHREVEEEKIRQLDRIDNYEMIQRLMWQDYLLERSPYKRVMILKEIKELQPYISSYYDATRAVIQLCRSGVPCHDTDTEPLPSIE